MSTVSTAVQMSRDASVQMLTVSTAVQMSRCRGMLGCADVDYVDSCADVEKCICADVDIVGICADVEGCICTDVAFPTGIGMHLHRCRAHLTNICADSQKGGGTSRADRCISATAAS
ncbi:hypothetical protein HaLaN_32754 [Haematococcus lacustris]|uniref:Uncharacterized protein n=1 Tax=Haematococcus lacustris TaxID=44745 RepID=A0A6A0ANW5_HAELA|nr:hypothetical protein HaLaN_32754 [Haematococcus lacustris]